MRLSNLHLTVFTFIALWICLNSSAFWQTVTANVYEAIHVLKTIGKYISSVLITLFTFHAACPQPLHPLSKLFRTCGNCITAWGSYESNDFWRSHHGLTACMSIRAARNRPYHFLGFNFTAQRRKAKTYQQLKWKAWLLFEIWLYMICILYKYVCRPASKSHVALGGTTCSG